MIEQTLYAPLVFALCAVAWNRITEPGEIFGWLPPLLFKRQYLSDTAAWWQYWIARVTWACSKCIAGFWCLVYCIVYVLFDSFDFGLIPLPLLSVAGALIIERYLQD